MRSATNQPVATTPGRASIQEPTAAGSSAWPMPSTLLKSAGNAPARRR
jgi:hypothetical protein